MIPLKPKTCRSCKQPFVPRNRLQVVCSPRCALIEVEKSNLQKARRKKLVESRSIRAQKDALKTRSDWVKEAQREFNRFIRLRDKGKPCISCGRMHAGQIHASHYRSTGAHPELRFHPMNCHAACQPCNTQLSGNLIEYRKALVLKYGVEKVEWLEGNHPPAKWTIEELKRIKTGFALMAKKLEKESENGQNQS